jgi:hypothetical protein
MKSIYPVIPYDNVWAIDDPPWWKLFCSAKTERRLLATAQALQADMDYIDEMRNAHIGDGSLWELPLYDCDQL